MVVYLKVVVLVVKAATKSCEVSKGKFL